MDRAEVSAALDLGSPEVTIVPAADSVEAARAAGLRYVTDASPGIRRVREGSSFAYVDADGKPVSDEQTLARISSLVIPPAWNDVWICPSPRGHIQAVGRDARGRKQYRYHPRFREIRDEAKYARMLEFVRALPRIRRRVARELNRKGLCREKVLAAVVRLLETTLIRVGNEEYAEQNGHFGLTTLRNKHAAVRGATVHFQFKGKSGVVHKIDLLDPRIARIIRKCQELPGEDLFEYIDDEGNTRRICSEDVNDYLREITGREFTAKDFRTWGGTVLAAKALAEFEPCDSQTQSKKNVLRAIEQVAAKLGNTRAVCRKCYIHPIILDSYQTGELAKAMSADAQQTLKKRLSDTAREAAVLALLERRLSAEKRNARRASKR